MNFLIATIAFAILAQLAKGIITNSTARRVLTMAVMAAVSASLGSAVILATAIHEEETQPTAKATTDTVVVIYADEPATDTLTTEAE